MQHVLFRHFPVTVSQQSFPNLVSSAAQQSGQRIGISRFSHLVKPKKHPLFSLLASQSSVCSPYLRLSFLLANPSYTFLTQKIGHFSPILRALLVDTMARPSFHVTSFLKAFSPDPGYPPPTCLVSSFSPSTLFVTSGLCSRCIDILYLVQSLYAHPRRSLLSFNLPSRYLVLYLRTTQPPVFPRA